MSELDAQLRKMEHRTDKDRFLEVGKLLRRQEHFEPGKRKRIKGTVVALRLFLGHKRFDGSWMDFPNVTCFVDIGERYLVSFQKHGVRCYEKMDLGGKRTH